MSSADPLHASIDEHLRHILAERADHERRSRDLLILAANYRILLLKEKLRSHFGDRVATGPFAGMRLSGSASEGCVIPKILGCYEAPLAPYFLAAARRNIDIVLNIGCAEGYYAVGLARLLPQARIHAFDIDPRAREMCGDLARLNGVKDRISISGLFEGKDFESFAGKRVLVLCDIEGAEKTLIDPAAYPALCGFDLVVELHDNTDPTISRTLPQRFSDSHTVEIFSLRSRSIDLPPLFEGLREIDQLLSIWEMRGGPTPWAVMRTKAF